MTNDNDSTTLRSERDSLAAEVKALRGALELERMRLTACFHAALGNDLAGVEEQHQSKALGAIRALRADLGLLAQLTNQLAEERTTLAEIETVCTAHNYDPGAGEPVADWIAKRLDELRELMVR